MITSVEEVMGLDMVTVVSGDNVCEVDDMATIPDDTGDVSCNAGVATLRPVGIGKGSVDIELVIKTSSENTGEKVSELSTRTTTD